MVTRSIVGRFLILAVLIVSLGVIAQAALIITRGADKKAVKTASAETIQAPSGEVAPIRVVYPGPLGDASAQPRKIADAAPASPLAAPATPAPSQVPAPVQSTTAQAAAVSQPPVAQQPAALPPAPAPAAPTPVAVAQAAQPAAAPVAPAAQAQPVSATPAPVVVASIDPAMNLPAAPAQPGHAADAAPASDKGININSAPMEVLNHLHGGGRIGQTIIQHRPYKSVEDLVKKRVLRRSVYEQIKTQIAAR